MTNYVRNTETGICECPSTTHDSWSRPDRPPMKCLVKCSGATPVRDSSSGDCRAYVCADNGDTANSGLTDYEAGKTLTLPSDKCISRTSCEGVTNSL
jgi:hypothetical protein